MDPKKTRFEIFNSRVKNNPLVAFLIVFGTIVIALSTFTNAARNLLGLISKPEIVTIDGRWVTQELATPFDKKNKFKLYFDLELKDDTLFGVIRMASMTNRYDITQGIMGGTIKGNIISFHTIERSIFGRETITYKNYYHGSVLADEIQFVFKSDRPWGYPPQSVTAKRE